MEALPLRLSPGADLRAAIEAEFAAHSHDAAFVLSGVGSLTEARLRLAGAAEPDDLRGDLEILTLAGTIARNGSHLHMSVADAGGRVVGGHVARGCIVRTTAEVLLLFLPDWSFNRELDPATGFAELVASRRDSHAYPNRNTQGLSVAVNHQALLKTMIVYHEAFAERDAARRLELLARSMTPNAEIWGPKRIFAGYETISAKIEAFHENWPGCRLALTTGFNTFLNTAHLGIAIIGPDGSVRASGRSVIELAGDGRIQRVLPLWEALPPLPAGWPEQFAPTKHQDTPSAA